MPLHMDGARLWESAAYYDRDYAAIAAGFDSVYVSVYKGIRRLRRRAARRRRRAFIAKGARAGGGALGGTLYHLEPAGRRRGMRFDERIALMPALYRRAVGPRRRPRRPAGTARQPRGAADEPDASVPRRARPRSSPTRDDAGAGRRGCWLVNGARPAEVPGWSMTELYVGDQLLGVDNERVVGLFAELCER